MKIRRLLIVAPLVVAACGGGSDDAAGNTSSPDVASATSPATDPPATDPPATDPPATDPPAVEPIPTEPPVTEPAVAEPASEPSPWARIAVDSDGCACSDGSEFELFERPGDPSKVMFYFEGGGACFSEETCDPNGDPTYTTSITQTVDSLDERGGLFDADNPENPLADYSIVYVPYCTGDVHLGDARTEYTPDVTIEHRGAPNATAALEHLVATYPDAIEILVTGASAGSVPTPIMAGRTADLLPAARITTFGDSSGAYPDVPGVNQLIGDLWGTTNAIPDWPVNDGLTAAEWSFPGLYIQAGMHNSNITFGRFDYAFDNVQATFAALAGVGADAVVEQIDATEAQIEATGLAVATYVAPGNEHTIMGTDLVYEMEVEGVRLIDWVTDLVTGSVPPDVHCVECTSG